MTRRCLGLMVLLTVASPAVALYDVEDETLSLSIAGSVRVNDTVGWYPSVLGLPPEIDRSLNIAGALARLTAVASAGEHLSLEVHLLGLATGRAAAPFLDTLGGAADGFGGSDAGRFGGLALRIYDRRATRLAVEVDRLNLRLTLPHLELTVGRQPVNLATTTLFTPNDFWQPFDAQTFFRVYKPGVDAARAEVELGGFTRVSLIGVLGFERAGSPPTADDPLSGEEASLLARASTTLFDLDWTVLGGRVPQRWIVGGALQGELLEVVGVRAEGHYAVPLDEAAKPRLELAVGLEHRFESSLFLRAEYFFHGAGTTEPGDYLGRGVDPVFLAGPRYLGRHQLAAAASYEVTPLLNADALVLVNASDGSFTTALNAVYSLDDDIEASLAVAVPVGATPTLDALRSEHGSAPLTVAAELRAYF